jgi:hypothetical protein
MREYPFFIIVDDGGFDTVSSGEHPEKIALDTYETILRIAKAFSMRIPVCFTLRHLDRKNISRCNAPPLGYLDDLVSLLKENRDHIEVGYHGLTHEYNGHVGEFYCLDTHEPVHRDIQSAHLEMSAEIFAELGFDFPELFVPPYHAWEWGVTDHLAAQFGVKYLVSVPKLVYGKYLYRWRDSDWVHFLHRDHVGIFSYNTLLDGSHLKIAQELVLPRSLRNNFRFRRRLFNPRLHSYMSHIGNFLPINYEFWARLFTLVKQRPGIRICEDNLSAVKLFIGEGAAL